MVILTKKLLKISERKKNHKIMRLYLKMVHYGATLNHMGCPEYTKLIFSLAMLTAKKYSKANVCTVVHVLAVCVKYCMMIMSRAWYMTKFCLNFIMKINL